MKKIAFALLAAYLAAVRRGNSPGWSGSQRVRIAAILSAIRAYEYPNRVTFSLAWPNCFSSPSPSTWRDVAPTIT